MNLNHLAVFHAVAEEGSVSRGAERLHVSQPAVSKQLRELERSLGMALFYRLSTGVRLTNAGQLLWTYSKQLFALETEAEGAMHDLRELRRGTLTVGASTTIGSYLLPDICAAYSTLYPGISLRLEINNTVHTIKLLLDNAVDLALTEGFVELPHLTAETFLQDKIVAVTAPNHPLAQKEAVSLGELADFPLILRECGSGTREVVERALVERDITIAPAMTLGHTEAIKRAVVGGAGWAFLSRLAVEHEAKTGRLHILQVEGWEVQRPFHRLKLSDKYEGRAVREFLRMLRAGVSALDSKAAW
jgi:DNA-binding transcriptional LysR family regulator